MVVSLMPGRHLPVLLIWGFIPADKLGHFAVYFLLEVLMLWPLRLQYKSRQLRSTPGVVEILQELFETNRAFEIGDIAANSLGTATGLAGFIYAYYHILKKN